jgi:hypothetical protein
MPEGVGPLRPVWRFRARQGFDAGDSGVACGDVDGDGAQEVLVGETCRARGESRVAVLDAGGNEMRSFPVVDGVSDLDIGRRPGGSLVLAFGTWAREVDAYDGAGKSLWAYAGSNDGVDWACTADVGAPAGDGVAVSYNGDGGLHLVGPDGARRWAQPGLANVWSVTAARLVKGAPCAIVCTPISGRVRAYDSTGHQLFDAQPGGFFCPAMVDELHAVNLDGGATDQILALGSTILGRGGELWALDARGRTMWTYDVGARRGPAGFSATAGRFAPPGRQVAVAAADGTITVLDARGRVMGRQALGAKIASIRTLPGLAGKPDRLVVGTKSGCTCYAWRSANVTGH